jgi:hypothetical protein
VSEHTITMERAPTLSETECRRRRHKAYQVILAAAARRRARIKKEADSAPNLGGSSAPSASDAIQADDHLESTEGS